MEWIVGQIAFAFAFQKVEPAKVVDKIIEIVVDVLTPGRGAGESNWWMRTWRSLEHHHEKSSRELDIRSNLREWDSEFPYLHHELIIRYAAGFLAYSFATSLYAGFMNRGRGHKRQHFR
mmetsp:Transcript_15526/g.24134  ORF Transcript_15526/g.24134 Transcript_15526/m.24134 type:complete len:119 (-) Transcript_15526:314-670(-)